MAACLLVDIYCFHFQIYCLFEQARLRLHHGEILLVTSDASIHCASMVTLFPHEFSRNYCRMDTNETRQDPVEMLMKYLELGKNGDPIYKDRCEAFTNSAELSLHTKNFFHFFFKFWVHFLMIMIFHYCTGERELIESILYDAEVTRSALSTWMKQMSDETRNDKISRK